MKIGIVGCGLIGARRARVARAAGDEILLVADINAGAAQVIAAEAGSEWTDDWRVVTGHPQIEMVVVATVNKALLPITVASLQNGKHVLCEKPLGRNGVEALVMVQTATRHHRILKAGFNHRHHPAIWRAQELAKSGKIGPLASIRAAYGHGGRPGYDQEWRGNADLAGGGELLDQGVHLVDLCRWFFGEFVQVTGMLGTWFWRIAPLEDNCFALLRTAAGQIAAIHTSWTQWKNLFRFEIFGRDGYLSINGLGGSYGTETLTLGIRRPESGPPLTESWEFPGPDISWQAEWEEFKAAIQEGRQPLGNGDDGYQAARVIDAIYQSAKTGGVVELGAGLT
ncbi:MAG: gfo/Idh/MocA family oxidoreductase [Deltaproteobacteria bacterium]|nr:MAG: gfo/Idh/MocA family oxidoreductase [Deltaproteobacteria bacterium]